MNVQSKAEVEEQVIAFLDANSTHPSETLLPGCGLKHGIACALGTCKDNMPRVTPIDFFNDGLDIWMIGDPGGKIANIKANPNVAVGIYTRIDHSVENRSLQIWGEAALITRKSDTQIFTQMAEQFGLIDAVRRGTKFNLPEADDDQLEKKVMLRLGSITLIRVRPIKIIMLISKADGSREKLVWQ